MEVRIKINGKTWTVAVVSPKEMKKHREDGEALAGLCVIEDRAIYISNDSITYNTIIHELFHSYWSSLHLEDTSDLSLGDIEEIAASMVADKADEMVRKARSVYKKLSKGEE